MQEGTVSLKVFDKKKSDVVFEGKVSTDVEPHELLHLSCFRERYLFIMFNRATNEEVKSFKGLQNNVELVASVSVDCGAFLGVLYVGVDDGVLRKSDSVPPCRCVMMSVWYLSQEECEKAFNCETLEELGFNFCKMRQIPTEIGKMKKLKKLRLRGSADLKSLPEEIGDLSSLEELWIRRCGIESLPKRLKELKVLILRFWFLFDLQLKAEDLVVFSKLKHLTIKWCHKVFTPSFTEVFLDMIKSTTDLRVLELDWWKLDEEMVAAALEENGSIVDGGEESESYAHIFKRNKSNHEKAIACALQLLAIRICRNLYNYIPKEMFQMLSKMLWNTRCDVDAWAK